jgi:heme oxygenase
MKPLKEATHDKHKEAERMLFNVKMFKGELTKEQYGKYLLSQLEIFSAIEENFEMPHEGLRRKEAVMKDLKSLGIYQLEIVDNGTLEYVSYLRGLTQEEVNAHIYLNYLAIMFGGQMMKKMTPGEGNMYEFDDMNESAAHIRAIQKDEWADEVNKGFDFMIEIFKELEKCLTTS